MRFTYYLIRDIQITADLSGARCSIRSRRSKAEIFSGSRDAVSQVVARLRKALLKLGHARNDIRDPVYQACPRYRPHTEKLIRKTLSH